MRSRRWDSLLVIMVWCCATTPASTLNARMQPNISASMLQQTARAAAAVKNGKPMPSATGTLSMLKCNSLGGFGPSKCAKTPFSMVFADVMRLKTISLDLVVTNSTPYYVTDSRLNGVAHGISYLSVMRGRPLGLNFELVSAITGELAQANEFRLTLLDLDASPFLRETVIVHGASEYHITAASSIQVAKTSTGAVKFTAGAMNNRQNNPYSPDTLTEEQANCAVGLVFRGKSNFNLIFGLEDNVQNSLSTQLKAFNAVDLVSSTTRNMMFAASSSIFSPQNVKSVNALMAMAENLPIPPPSSASQATLMARTAAHKARLQFNHANVTEADIDSDGRGVQDVPTRSAETILKAQEVAAGMGTQCASENSEQLNDCEECTMSKECYCPGGRVRFGYWPHWGSWIEVDSSVSCSAGPFGDPWVGHGKVCVCLLQQLSAGELCEARKGNFSWPTVVVSLVLLACFLGQYLGRYQIDASSCPPGLMERSFDAAMPVVKMSPMLCVIFVALATRQAFRSPTEPLPPWFQGPQLFGVQCTQAAVIVCVVAFCLITFFRYQAERDYIRATEGAVDVNDLKVCLTLYRVSCATLYIFGAFLVVRVFANSGTADSNELDVTVACATILAAAHLSTNLAVLILEPRHGECEPERLTLPTPALATARTLASNLDFTPMIGALSLALYAATASMSSGPPEDLQEVTLLCTVSVLAQAALAVSTPTILAAEHQQPGGSNLVADPLSVKGRFFIRTPDDSGIWLIDLLNLIVSSALLVGLAKLALGISMLQSCPRGLGTFVSPFAFVFLVAHAAHWVSTSASQTWKQTLKGYGEVIATVGSVREYADVFCPLVVVLAVSWWVAGGPAAS